jgi:uncharacterized protein (TIGR02453 family)
MSTFSGFPHQAVQFLLDLRHNNNREWFKTNKSDFDQYLMEPAEAFSKAMSIELQRQLSRAGSQQLVKHSIFRIYRDIRFSSDKTPYKTHLGIWFWQGERPRMENSGFYFHLEPPKLMLAVGLHTFPTPMLKAYRNAVVDDELGLDLLSAVEEVESAGDYKVDGKHYKRIPRGFDPTHPRAEWLLNNGLFVSTEDLIPEALYKQEIVDYCLDHYSQMVPLHHWLNQFIAHIETLAADN